MRRLKPISGIVSWFEIPQICLICASNFHQNCLMMGIIPIGCACVYCVLVGGRRRVGLIVLQVWVCLMMGLLVDLLSSLMSDNCNGGWVRSTR